MAGFDFIHPRPIHGRGFIWKPYNGEDFFSKKRFTLDQWHNILGGINNKKEFDKYLYKYRNILSCYVLFKIESSVPIAMCLILEENGWFDNCFPGEVVSVHGGGWNRDASSQYLYAKAWIRIIHYLYELKCRVLTDFNQNNRPAKHLIEGTGFLYNDEINMYEYSPLNDKFIRLKQSYNDENDERYYITNCRNNSKMVK